MNRTRDLLITVVCRLLSIPFAILSRPLPADRSFSSIVIVKPCCIGDVTLASAVLAAVRQAYPKARIAFAVSAWAREAILHNPRLDEIIDCGNVGSGRKFDWHEYLAMVHRIRQGGFDLAIVLERSPILNLIPFLAGVPHRAGIDSSGRGFSLTVKAPWRACHHEAELYLDVVRALGIPSDGCHAEFFPSCEDTARAKEVLQSVNTGSGRFAIIHPGGAANPGMVLSAKRWPPDRYALLADRFIDEGWTVLLVGADSDRPTADAFLAALDESHRSSGKVVDMVGELSLGELAAVAQRIGAFVGNDTGPMHMASAAGTPTVAIFGPSTPDMYAPFGTRSIAVYNKVDCSPCFVKGRFNNECRHFKCMQAVDVEDVWQAVKQVMAE